MATECSRKNVASLEAIAGTAMRQAEESVARQRNEVVGHLAKLRRFQDLETQMKVINAMLKTVANEVEAAQRREQRRNFTVRKSTRAVEADPHSGAFPVAKTGIFSFSSKRVEETWKALSECPQPQPLCPTPAGLVRGSQLEAEQTCILAVDFLNAS